MKSIFKISLLFILTTICIQHSVLALEEKTYYTCPSQLFYNPELTQDNYCKRLKALVGGEFVRKGVCTQSYNDGYKNANLEYKYGQCRISNRRFIEGTYNTAICNVDFVLTPTPRIMGFGSWNVDGIKGTDGAACIEQLTKQLKTTYPNIQNSKF